MKIAGKPEPLLILLVGANPLPNYLSACALQPGLIALVHTEETKDAMRLLKRTLKHHLSDVVRFVDPDPFVADATCATTVRRVIDRLLAAGRETWLSYTGGTKVMAVHAYMAHARSGGRTEQASYLDEGGIDQQPRLRFDDGTSNPLSEYTSSPLDLATILQLHGIEHKPRTPKVPAPTQDDAQEILAGVLRDVCLAERLYEKRGADLKELAEDFGLTLSLCQYDTDTIHKKALDQWRDFIGGVWLEEWVGEQVRRLDLTPTPEITVGLNAFRGKRKAQLELDVAVVRGHRSYFISCTTERTKRPCKSKLFEIAVRSRHLGGDLARAALVCLADDRTAAELQADIDDVWGASNTTRVFGLSDVTDWSDYGAKQPNRHSLRTWMEN